jgi:hypothetical protein
MWGKKIRGWIYLFAQNFLAYRFTVLGAAIKGAFPDHAAHTGDFP